jgi:glucan phosphoethanolaminetransferase (alkaline phosphatase superfamily)
MAEQSFKSHSKYVPLYHFYTLALWLCIFIGSIVNIIKSKPENIYSAWLVLALTILSLLIAFFARSFALKAQDRVIRAEENFRHYLLTAKPLPKELRLRQIIALRFASDEEFVQLVQKAVEEKLDTKAIKQMIKVWRADYSRL